MLQPTLLRDNFSHVAKYGDEVPLYFYSYLFLRHPEVRNLFPAAMAAQRDRLLGALVEIITQVDNPDDLLPFLSSLGRDHRKFEVSAEHYPAVGEALIATLKHFSGESWSDELSTQWAAAYAVVAQAMIESANVAAAEPPWTAAEVIAHDRRDLDLAVITIRAEMPLNYRAGQSLSLHIPQRPRMWRFFSPTEPVRADGQFSIQVRAVDGGWVSSALVHSTMVGDSLRIGPAVGTLQSDLSDPRPILLLASGTGLAPLMAIAQEILDHGQRQSVSLIHQVQSRSTLFATAELDFLAKRYANFQYLGNQAAAGDLAPTRAVDLALERGIWRNHVIYLCGSASFVRAGCSQLIAAGIPASDLRYETFSYRMGPRQSPMAQPDLDANFAKG